MRVVRRKSKKKGKSKGRDGPGVISPEENRKPVLHGVDRRGKICYNGTTEGLKKPKNVPKVSQEERVTPVFLFIPIPI